MSDLTLSDGREVTLDLYKMSMKEYRAVFFDPKVEDAFANKVLENVSGLKKVEELPQPDYRMLINKVYEKSTRPLSDPNLSSGSSSQSKKEEKDPGD